MGNKMSHNNENHSDAAPGGMAGGGGGKSPPTILLFFLCLSVQRSGMYRLMMIMPLYYPIIILPQIF